MSGRIRANRAKSADMKASDEFGPETLALLGRFTKLLSALVKSYNDKYDLMLDIELMSSIYMRMGDRFAYLGGLPTAAPFGGRSALAHMLGGNVADLYVVRRYLDGVRGGGWS